MNRLAEPDPVCGRRSRKMALTEAILESNRAAGHSVGTGIAWTNKGLQHVVTAGEAKTDEKWTVMANREHDAAAELAARLGFDLEE